MRKDQNTMPDVPPPDFVGAVAEIWSTVNYAAYHLAYTRVYSRTRALQTSVDELRRDEQAVRDQGQVTYLFAARIWRHSSGNCITSSRHSNWRSGKARRTTDRAIFLQCGAKTRDHPAVSHSGRN